MDVGCSERTVGKLKASDDWDITVHIAARGGRGGGTRKIIRRQTAPKIAGKRKD